MIRKPAKAGQFYAGSRDELEKQIRECFLSDFGPGSLPKSNGKRAVKAIISPHAGYMFSGPCTAYGFKEIAEGPLANVYIILGFNHGMSRSGISLDDWQTPLGVLKNDTELSKIIMKNCGLDQDEYLHRGEHSLEVQLPFLQFITKNNQSAIRIVPVSVAEDRDITQLGQGIKKGIEEYGKEVTIIASSDFTHYGPGYGFIPFTDDRKKNMENLDKGAIEFIVKKDPQRFLDYIQQTGATICGRVPIAVLLNTVDSNEIQLLKYYTSGDVVNDYTDAVGYASIVLR